MLVLVGLSGAGVGESVEEFEKRMLSGLDDGLENRRGGSDWGWRGGFRNRVNSSSILAELGTGFDSLEDGLDEKLDEASRTFHVTEEYEDDDYDYRPDVTFRRGSTYNVKVRGISVSHIIVEVYKEHMPCALFRITFILNKYSGTQR